MKKLVRASPRCTTTSVLDASFIRVRAPQPVVATASPGDSMKPAHNDLPASLSARKPSVRTNLLW